MRMHLKKKQCSRRRQSDRVCEFLFVHKAMSKLVECLESLREFPCQFEDFQAFLNGIHRTLEGPEIVDYVRGEPIEMGANDYADLLIDCVAVVMSDEDQGADTLNEWLSRLDDGSDEVDWEYFLDYTADHFPMLRDTLHVFGWRNYKLP